MRLLLFLLLVGCTTPSDGPDTTQKYDPIHGYNFGTK
jgi:hypothetical protein